MLNRLIGIFYIMISLMFMGCWTPISQAAEPLPQPSQDQVMAWMKNIMGDVRITRTKYGAIVLNLPANQTTDQMVTTLSNKPQVFAKYHPDGATGRIDVVTLRKLPTGRIEIQVKPWGPKEGARWAVQRDRNNAPFAAAESMRRGLYMGLNPFEKFYARSECAPVRYTGSSSDDTRNGWYLAGNTVEECNYFRNISEGAFKTAVGLAMAQARSDDGLLSVLETRISQGQRKSGGFLRKKVTLYLDAYVKPKWFVLAPQDRGMGVVDMYCATESDECPHENTVINPMGVTDWNKGNLDRSEYHAYHHEEDKSGMGIIAMALIVFAVVALAVFTAGAGAAALTAVEAVGTASLGSLATTAAIAGMEAVGVVAAAAVVNGGGVNGSAMYAWDGRRVQSGSVPPGVMGDESSPWNPTAPVRQGMVLNSTAETPGSTGIEINRRRYQRDDQYESPALVKVLRDNIDTGGTVVPDLMPSITP